MGKYDKYKKITIRMTIILWVIDLIVDYTNFTYSSSSFSIILMGGFIYSFINEYMKYKSSNAEFPKAFGIITVAIIILSLFDIARNLGEILF